MQESKIIGNRAKYKTSTILVVLLYIQVIGELCLIIAGMLIDDAIGKTMMLMVGICFLLGRRLGIFSVFRRKNFTDKAGDKPTIVLEGNDTLRLFLIRGKEEKIKLSSIKKVQYILRHTSSFDFMKIVHNFHNDGKLILRLEDGKTKKISCVDKLLPHF